MPLRVVPQRDRKLNRLIRQGREVDCVRGARLYAPGDVAEELFVVRKGHVQLFLPSGAGADGRVVALAGPMELFGLEALEDDRPRRLGARAGEAASLVALPGSRALRALRTTRHTLRLLLGTAREDLDRARWAGPGAGGPSTSARLADLLLELAARMGEEIGQEGAAVRIPHWLTHQSLADLVGGHRSTVTTQINEWIYEGILADEGHALRIVRPGVLAERSSGREAWISGR